MLWLNLDVLKGTPEDHIEQNSLTSRKNAKPAKRWGQAAVHANNRLYIIGGYEGKLIAIKLSKY